VGLSVPVVGQDIGIKIDCPHDIITVIVYRPAKEFKPKWHHLMPKLSWTEDRRGSAEPHYRSGPIGMVVDLSTFPSPLVVNINVLNKNCVPTGNFLWYTH
jgi:hypothetical protein